MNIFFFFQAEDGIRDYKVTGVQTCALPIYVPLDVPAEPPGGEKLGGQGTPESDAPVGGSRAGAHDCTTVTTRPIDARMLPTRTHSVSAPTLTTALPVLCTCQASSQPLASLQPIAFWSCFTTCSN